MAEGNPIKYSDLVIDDGAIDKLIKALEMLEKNFLSSQKKFRSEIEKTRKSATTFTEATENQETELEKLEKQLEKLIKANKELQDSEEQIKNQKKSAIKLAKEEQKLKQKLIDLESEQAKENAKLKIEISERNKQIKEQIKREKGLTNAYDDQSKRLGKLRKQYKGLAVEGKANTKAAQALLKEVTELDEKLKDVDKSVGQTQREVGNYKDQVKEALQETNLWGDSMAGAVDQSGLLGQIMGQLNVVIGILTKSFAKENEEVIENTVVSKVNEKQQKKQTIAYLGLSRAVKTTGRSFKVLNRVVKATAIGALIATLASLAAFFKKTQSGSDALAGSMDKLSGGYEVVAGRAGKVGESFIDQFKGNISFFVSSTKAILNGNKKDLIKSADEFKEVAKKGVKVLKEQTDDLGKAVVNAANKTKELGDRYRKLAKDSIPIREEIARLNAEAEKAEEIEGDATKSFVERANAIQVASLKQSEAADKNLDLLRQEFEIEKELLQIKKDSGTAKTEDLQEFSNKSIELIEAEKDAELKALQIMT